MSFKQDLLPFYFGSLSDEKRLSVEREMLADPEVLLDYLDLKRKIEGAGSVPQTPSPLVWQRLQSKIAISRRTKIGLLIGVGVAAAVAVFFIFSSQNVGTKPTLNGKAVLFDSGSEQFGHSNVL